MIGIIRSPVHDTGRYQARVAEGPGGSNYQKEEAPRRYSIEEERAGAPQGNWGCVVIVASMLLSTADRIRRAKLRSMGKCEVEVGGS